MYKSQIEYVNIIQIVTFPNKIMHVQQQQVYIKG